MTATGTTDSQHVICLVMSSCFQTASVFSFHIPAGKVLEQNHNALMFETTSILQKEKI